jgi:hypothetical protein
MRSPLSLGASIKAGAGCTICLVSISLVTAPRMLKAGAKVSPDVPVEQKRALSLCRRVQYDNVWISADL